MGICYIIGAGDCAPLTFTPQPGDFVIAADAGLRYLEKAGMQPDLIVGDFDSLGYVPQFAPVKRLPVIKDETDLQKAVDVAIDRGYRTFRIYGALGGARLSHTVANLQMLCDLAARGMDAVLFAPELTAYALHNGKLTLPSRLCGFVSVFAANDVCTGVTIRGLKYELAGETLRSNFALGVSNEFIGKQAEISVEDGTLLILVEELAVDIF
ncbi:MAG: thiamine diphosphokinase [Clostridia bacterium]|nr:thiamine diphosphokinase [Clostridia bacterium]